MLVEQRDGHAGAESLCFRFQNGKAFIENEGFQSKMKMFSIENEDFSFKVKILQSKMQTFPLKSDDVCVAGERRAGEQQRAAVEGGAGDA